MNRTTAGIVFTIGFGVAALTGNASAQNSQGSSTLDASLRGAVERKDVPGVVALVTNRERVLYKSAFGVADVATGRALNVGRAVSHRLDDQAGHVGGIDAAYRAGPPRAR